MIIKLSLKCNYIQDIPTIPGPEWEHTTHPILTKYNSLTVASFSKASLSILKSSSLSPAPIIIVLLLKSLPYLFTNEFTKVE